jgi:hypothetical protein
VALPSLLRINAFTGAFDSGSPLGAQAGKWIGANIYVPPKIMSAIGPLARVVNPAEWSDPDVGWGIVLPENPALKPEERAAANDAPEPIRRLLKYRNGVVLRWSAALPLRKLRRYYTDGTVNDPDVALSPRGTGHGRIPRYLLICAPPSAIPWRVQYRLNAVAFTGRLDLEGQALSNYVDAAVSGWSGAAAVPQNSVTWAVDHGGADITHLMRTVIAKKLATALQANSNLGAHAAFIDGAAAPATGPDLVANLASRQPALVVTSSHGMTGPLNDVPTMSAQLGVPVDGHGHVLDRDDLLKRWSPDGAIWYAHACCSAGSDVTTSFDGLMAAGSFVEQVVKGVAACGAIVAPLPRELLGAPRPLRAFIGHIEPTFDWSLRDTTTGQVLTTPLVEVLHNRLYAKLPVGFAFETLYAKASQLDSIHRDAKDAYNGGGDTLSEALTCRLIAQDIANVVILGDPAEALY